MSANKLSFPLNGSDKQVNLTVMSNWEPSSLTEGYEKYEEKVVMEIINPITDYEVDKFSHANYVENWLNKTGIVYSFNFMDQNTNILQEDYSSIFTEEEVYYGSNSYKGSFFKLDLYDQIGSSEQTIYMTIIIPTYQGVTYSTFFNNVQVDIRKPRFILDHVGDKEGFFIFWLKKRDHININEFYMSAKFFDGKNGTFRRFTNSPQTTTTFNNDDLYYYKVVLNQPQRTYEVFRTDNGSRAGSSNNPIRWYEYP